jgi:hypothetical protein
MFFSGEKTLQILSGSQVPIFGGSDPWRTEVQMELNIEKVLPDQRVVPLKSLIPGKFPQPQYAAIKGADLLLLARGNSHGNMIDPVKRNREFFRHGILYLSRSRR